jgi:hypothetical protein
MVVASPPMTVHLIPNLGAILVVVRSKTNGRVAILVDPDEPRDLILGVARPTLFREERQELRRALRQM